MQALRDLMRRSLARSLDGATPEDRLHMAWPLVCGSGLASKAEVLHLDREGVLHVRVTNSLWRDRFFEMRTRLCEDLRRVANVPLSGVHFTTAQNFTAPPNFTTPQNLTTFKNRKSGSDRDT